MQRKVNLRHIRKTMMGVTAAACLLTPAASSAQPSAAPPSSASQSELELAGSKAKSPPTDLQRYPKGKLAPQSSAKSLKPAAAGQDESKEVLAKQALPDGRTRYTSYTPARGVTPRQLAAKLRRTGVTAEVVTPGESAGGGVSTFAGLCGYGIARTLNCPAFYWRNNGYDDPQVYFVDHTGWQWPTDAAVYTWNQSYGIDSYYAWNGCPGYGGTHCVHVWSGYYGTGAGWSGNTTWYTNSDNSFADGQTVVYLNDSYSYTSTETRMTVCHELGHALGLDHAVGPGSCLYAWSSAYPHSNDFSLLADIYSVYR
jgi:hypothetical protein